MDTLSEVSEQLVQAAKITKKYGKDIGVGAMAELSLATLYEVFDDPENNHAPETPSSSQGHSS